MRRARAEAQRDSLLRLLAPVPMVPRHMADLEPRGEAVTVPGEWAGVGWVEDGPVRFPEGTDRDA